MVLYSFSCKSHVLGTPRETRDTRNALLLKMPSFSCLNSEHRVKRTGRDIPADTEGKKERKGKRSKEKIRMAGTGLLMKKADPSLLPSGQAEKPHYPPIICTSSTKRCKDTPRDRLRDRGAAQECCACPACTRRRLSPSTLETKPQKSQKNLGTPRKLRQVRTASAALPVTVTSGQCTGLSTRYQAMLNLAFYLPFQPLQGRQGDAFCVLI